MTRFAVLRAKWALGLPAALILVSAAAVYALSFKLNYFGRLNDDARFFLAAQSLLRGRYVDLAHPAEPPLLAPLPGYPLLLLPAAACGSIRLAQWMNVGFMLGALILLARLFGKTFRNAPAASRTEILAVLALTAFNPISVFQATAVMTEAAYFFFTAWSLSRLVELLDDPAKWNLRNALVLAVLCAFCGWIRPAGATLLLAATLLLLEQSSKRKWAWVFLAFGWMFFSLPYLRNLLVSGTPSSYFVILAGPGLGLSAQAEGLALTVASNLARYPALMTSESMFAWLPPVYGAGSTASVVFAVIVSGLLVWGLRARLTEGALGRTLGIYVVIYFVLHLFWVDQSHRYIFPILPFLYWFLLRPLMKAHGASAWGTAACCFLFILADGVNIERSRRPRTDGDAPPLKTAQWVQANVPEDGVLAACYYEVVRYYSGRKAVQLLSPSADPDEWFERLLSRRVGYVLDDTSKDLIAMASPTRRGLESAIGFARKQLGNPSRFRLSYQAPDEAVSVYQLLKPEGFNEGFHLVQEAKQAARAGRLESALRLLKQAEAMRAPLVRLAFYLGTTELLLGRKQEARKYLRRAVQAEPDFDLAKRNLSLCGL